MDWLVIQHCSHHLLPTSIVAPSAAGEVEEITSSNSDGKAAAAEELLLLFPLLNSFGSLRIERSRFCADIGGGGNPPDDLSSKRLLLSSFSSSGSAAKMVNAGSSSIVLTVPLEGPGNGGRGGAMSTDGFFTVGEAGEVTVVAEETAGARCLLGEANVAEDVVTFLLSSADKASTAADDACLVFGESKPGRRNMAASAAGCCGIIGELILRLFPPPPALEVTADKSEVVEPSFLRIERPLARGAGAAALLLIITKET